MGQFKALCYKNWILFKRSIVGSILEFFIPIIFVVFLLAVKNLLTVTNYNQQQYLYQGTPNTTRSYTADGQSAIYNYLKKCPAGQVVALAPSTHPFMTTLQTKLTSFNYTANLYSSQDQINSLVRDGQYGVTLPKFCFGIVMVSASGSSNYEYKLKFNITVVALNSEGPVTSDLVTSDKSLDLTTYDNSMKKGMGPLNAVMSSLIMNQQISATPTLTISPIYQQAYIDDPIYQTVGTTVQILCMLPLLIIYLRQTSSMLSEKQKKIRQTMSIMGMSTFQYYLTWFIRYFIVYAIVHIICSLVLRAALSFVTFIMIFIVFILFDILLIAQSFFIQTFFSRQKIGIVFALLFFVVQYVLSYIVTTSDNPTLSVNLSASIVPHIAFILCFKTMFYAQSVQVTPTWSMVLNEYTMATGLASLILNIVFWLVLTWYLDQVFPKEWGTAKHPCFCCVSNNSRAQEQPSMSQNHLVNSPIIQEGKAVEEEVQPRLKQMEDHNEIIRINNIHKKFGEIVAVNHLNMKIYNDQIFALLGHNGAGKTTTISMLTGMVEPTFGSINILGQNDVVSARHMIGICPQHDTLYDDLTVEEHLYLVGTFKGLEGEQLDQQVLKLVNDVNLMEKKDEYSMNLSGGQKRRLSVAMAFAGGSKVIILDEPTSGMDTSARRYIWEMLKDYKKDRIILLTTHFMDEADYLGDRIAIMGGGKLICCGSSIFLKNKFGVGYNITFVKKNNTHNSQSIIALVKKHIPSAVVLSDVSSQLSMQLPLEQVKHFDALFTEIEGKKKQLEVQTYGISITTLEEVFLKVTQESKEHQRQQNKQHLKSSDRLIVSTKSVKVRPQSPSPQIELNLKAMDKEKEKVSTSENMSQFDDNLLVKEQGCCGNFFRHLQATMLKRYRVIKRDYKSFIFELVLPILIIIFALLIMRISFVTDMAEREMKGALISDSSPMRLGIGSSDATLLTNVQSALNNKYTSKISLSTDTSSATDILFDSTFLKNIKTKYLRGGIFFKPLSVVNGSNVYEYTTLVNTRAGDTTFVLPILATETIINTANTSKTVTITAINSPFPRTQNQLAINNTISGFFAAFIFSIALAFKFASIIAFIVKERNDKSKHQQIVSGMNIVSYWIGNFLYDFLTYMIIAIASVVLIKLLGVSSLTDGQAYSASWALFILFGLAYIPFTYIMSYIFTDYGNAQAGWYFFTFICGGMLPVLTFVLRIIGTTTSKVGIGIAWPLKLLPCFAFGEGLLNIGSKTLYATIQLTSGSKYGVYDMVISGGSIVFLGVFFVVYWLFLFIIQKLQNTQKFMRFWTNESSYTNTSPAEDEDVLAEQARALAAAPQQYTILTKNLRKVYKLDSDAKFKVAVDSMSLAISQGEVFGLLGVNGAGKTTTFKMLAGEITSTSGDSYFMGMKISESLDRVRQSLGYCPQFDALIQNLTVRQQIELYYDLKSLPPDVREQAIDSKMKEMDLQEYSDKLSGTLSGGNKRKLSVAMAMIGNPKIIFLDEPSTGMDPKARRFMWKVISRIATEKKQSTIILTTHSMEEAEALSTRLGIMVGGNFKCIGTPQHIKSKYGQGYQIEVKINAPSKQVIDQRVTASKVGIFEVQQLQLPRVLQAFQASQQIADQIKPHKLGGYLLKTGKKIQINSIAEFIIIQQRLQVIKQWATQVLGDAQIIECYQTFIRFKTKSKIGVGKMFGAFQAKKQSINIQNYSIKQASVEQIFNKFADQQGAEMD